LLNLFAGEHRPGVPGTFPDYYPRGFKGSLPFYAFLSDTFQRAARGEKPALPGHQQRRYDELMRKRRENHQFKAEEEDDLYALQAEVDGRDYAVQMPDNSWLESMSKEQHDVRLRLGQLASDLAALTHKARRPHEDL
jgi:hypothetical protein